jgi:hypothetical protein
MPFFLNMGRFVFFTLKKLLNALPKSITASSIQLSTQLNEYSWGILNA